MILPTETSVSSKNDWILSKDLAIEQMALLESQIELLFDENNQLMILLSKKDALIEQHNRQIQEDADFMASQMAGLNKENMQLLDVLQIHGI